MEIKTKRAVIMVTDIVGYSALMLADIRNVLMILEKNRMIHRTTIRKFNGKFIKEIGDGILSIYDTSADAVNCAMELRKSCCREASLQLRIGIHTGKVNVTYSDVGGEAVTVASHIEACGFPGGIYLSERVYHEVKNELDVPLEFYAEKKLKNVLRTLKIYTIPAERTVSDNESLPGYHLDKPMAEL